jgi:lipopolysaccharide/colanic/teichoic acid biosynthesis glycosyltransferase
MPPSPFRRLLARERARADRCRSELCIVTFDVNSKSRQYPVIEKVTDWLKQPGHEMYAAGWIRGQRIAVLLPLADRNAAKVIARTIGRGESGQNSTVGWRVDSYPHRSLRSGKDASPDVKPQASAECLASPTTAGTEAIPAATSNTPNSRVAPFLQRHTLCSCPFWKRVIDIAGAGIGLAILSPLLVGIAAYIKCVSRGPVFFRQRRYGLAGRPFMVWKFRTLQVNEADTTQRAYMAELMENEKPMVKRDRQLDIIPGGRVLRKLGLDELPQLFNVLRGEMSIVGPRPHVVPFESYTVWQRRRFDVVPGITGLWQVSGKEETTFSAMMRLDIEYVRRRSLLFDFQLMLRTIPVLLAG